MQRPHVLKCRSLLCLALLIFTSPVSGGPLSETGPNNEMKQATLARSIQQHLEKLAGTPDMGPNESVRTDTEASKKDIRIVRSRCLDAKSSRIVCLVAVSKGRYVPMRFKAKIRDNGEMEIEDDTQYGQTLPPGEEARAKSAQQIARGQLQEQIAYWSALDGDALAAAAAQYKLWVDDQVVACAFSEQQGLQLMDGFGNRTRWEAIRDGIASKSAEELKTFLVEAGQTDLARLGKK